jgi:hypothetical protein
MALASGQRVMTGFTTLKKEKHDQTIPHMVG